jgi:hypothetical protein
MKMKRVVVQVTLECPADADALAHIEMSGGQLFKYTDKKLLKEEDLGDLYPLPIQKKNEFLMVRKIINDGLKKGMPKVGIRVYGSRNNGQFTFWADIGLKSRDFKKMPQPRHLVEMIGKFGPHHYIVNKGTLQIFRNISKSSPGGWPMSTNEYKTTTMSLGNPDIVDQIAAYVRKVIE